MFVDSLAIQQDVVQLLVIAWGKLFLCLFLTVWSIYGNQIKFYSRLIIYRSSEANVANNDSWSTFMLAGSSEQFSFYNSEVSYEIETQNECGSSSQSCSESTDHFWNNSSMGGKEYLHISSISHHALWCVAWTQFFSLIGEHVMYLIESFH